MSEITEVTVKVISAEDDFCTIQPSYTIEGKGHKEKKKLLPVVVKSGGKFTMYFGQGEKQ